MRTLVLVAALTSTLLAGCGGSSCKDACETLVDECGWFSGEDRDDRFGKCVDRCRDAQLEDETRDCLAGSTCDEREQNVCYASKAERDAFH